jgi:hypothetical protein
MVPVSPKLPAIVSAVVPAEPFVICRTPVDWFDALVPILKRMTLPAPITDVPFVNVITVADVRPTHGNCWLNPQSTGSGRFFQVSSKMQIEINPQASVIVVSGSAASNTLLITTEGKRVTRIIIDGVLLYNNSTGDINSGWSSSSTSCIIKGITFTSSAACNFYSLGVQKFQYDGGDSNPSLNPNMLEVNNDGSVVLLDSGIASSLDDASIFYEYMQTFTTGPAMPKISNRIIMP